MKSKHTHKQEEREFFNKFLDQYVEGFTKYRWKSYKTFVAKRFVGIDKPIRILDIGSGPAPSLEVLIKPENSYNCLDIAEANIKYINKNYPSCHAKLGDAENLTKYYKEKFDLIIFFGLLHHIPDPKKALKQAHNLLNDNGILIASEPSSFWNGKMPSPNEKGFSRKNLDEIFNEFSNVQIRTFNFESLEEKVWIVFNKIYQRNSYFGNFLWQIIFTLEDLLNNFGFNGRDFLVLAKNKN